ncbi:MAG: uroporphyrinogen-III C-methyltransferase [Actinomycetota bacterium]
MPGNVHIVGAGPGAADLLTVRAMSAILSAEVVLHDDLVSAEILAIIPAAAQIINVGKRCGSRANSQEKINALMVWHAHNGSRVVRLKSGDPAILGRLGEEMDALRREGITFEVIPGITAVSAAASAAGITLTDRRAASALVLSTAHHCRTGEQKSLPHGAGRERTTFAVYMPGPDYSGTARQLIQSGLNANTPCVLVSNASRSKQQVCHLTVSDLPFALGIAPPAVLIVGEVARKQTQQSEVQALNKFLEENHEPIANRNQNSPYQRAGA